MHIVYNLRNVVTSNSVKPTEARSQVTCRRQDPSAASFLVQAIISSYLRTLQSPHPRSLIPLHTPTMTAIRDEGECEEEFRSKRAEQAHHLRYLCPLQYEL
jgi:hypothetical protein